MRAPEWLWCERACFSLAGMLKCLDISLCRPFSPSDRHPTLEVKAQESFAFASGACRTRCPNMSQLRMSQKVFVR